jgi:cyanophycinase-like exopeptidase
MTTSKPIYAFADSTLFFLARPDGTSVLDEIVRRAASPRPRLAYIGSSNSDDMEIYHTLFEPAIATTPLGEHRMVLRRPSPQDAKFLEEAEIILLAGGDEHIGWRTFEKNGFKQLITRRFHEGALLIGVSAGAVQLGLGSVAEDGCSVLTTFGLLPFYVAAHDEKENWYSLRRLAKLAGTASYGVGISRGGGIRYEKGEIAILSGAVYEVATENGETREATIYPEQ